MQGSEDQLAALRRHAAMRMRQLLSAGASKVVDCPGYELFVWREPDVFYRSVALPLNADAFEPAAVAALADRFIKLGYTPHIEFFAECWPGLARVLQRQGWYAADDCQAMMLNETAAPGFDKDYVALSAASGRDKIYEFLSGMARAFGYTGPVTMAEMKSFHQGLREERIIAGGLEISGQILAGASLTHHIDLAELQGVWTDQQYRRLGFAQRVCSKLMSSYLSVEERKIWLSSHASHGAALYGQLGFYPIGTQQNYRLPH